MKKCLLILIVVSNLLSNQFERDDKLSIVFDNKNNLVWQDFKQQELVSIKEAKEYCSNLKISDFNNWRVPTLNELESITNYITSSVSKEFKYVNYPKILNNKVLGFYWTKNKVRIFNRYFVVSLDTSETSTSKSTEYIRCVHTNDKKNNLTKKSNLIIWQDKNDVLQYRVRWSEAKAYCEELYENGFNDWSLPSVENLKSIRNIRKHEPATNNKFKFLSHDYSYWSSNKVYSKNKIYTLSFDVGYISLEDKMNKNNVICLRNLKND